MSNTTGKHTPDYNPLDAWIKMGKDHHNISIIVTLCQQCGVYMGIKDGQGEYGVSHGLCPKCVNKQRAVIAQFKEDNKEDGNG